MEQTEDKRVSRVRKLILGLREKLETIDEVLGLIIYGSFSENTPHQPSKYSDVDMEIVLKDKAYDSFLNNFRTWFETNFEPVLIETRVQALQKIFVTKDFVDLQFHISKLGDFDEINKRPMNYFPNGYTLYFDKTGLLQKKITISIKPAKEASRQQKFDRLNNGFWYFVQGTAPYIKKGQFWFGAAGYWAWLYVAFCKLLRMYYKKDVLENNPMKFIEKDLDSEVISRIQPLRNLETENDLKSKMQLLISLYSEYAKKISKRDNLTYDQNIEDIVKQHVSQYLEK